MFSRFRGHRACSGACCFILLRPCSEQHKSMLPPPARLGIRERPPTTATTLASTSAAAAAAAVAAAPALSSWALGPVSQQWSASQQLGPKWSWGRQRHWEQRWGQQRRERRRRRRRGRICSAGWGADKAGSLSCRARWGPLESQRPPCLPPPSTPNPALCRPSQTIPRRTDAPCPMPHTPSPSVTPNPTHPHAGV